jgi:UDP-N-acetylmuramoyl-tripeptide--D-alanyl-D-alanine ligase
MTQPFTRASAPISLSDVLAAGDATVVGELDPSTRFRWIERDSRQVQPGDLFIAVKGEVHDGHSFLGEAAARGATAALVAGSWAAQEVDRPMPFIIVDEPVCSLQWIAARRRQTLATTVVGVTGSIGKTSTKEVIASVLGRQFRTYRSPGNMNSEIGLPLSLLEISPDIEVAVLEMGGAYAPGEVALLAEIARPLIGVVTNVHPVHLERMGTIEAIAETKTELIESLPGNGHAILNGDDHRVRAMRHRTSGRVLTYGFQPYNDIRASELETLGEEGIAFTLHYSTDKTPLRLPLVGSHAVELALAAIATGQAMGMELDTMLPGLMDRRAQIRLQYLSGPRGSRLIDDTYNASAPSVLSALGLLAKAPAVRRIAVLGDMRELGEESEKQHRIVGKRAAEIVDLLITYGAMARTIAEVAVETAKVDGRTIDVQSFGVEQREQLTETLLSGLRAGDLVLLKGSRGLEMERIVAALQHAAGAANSDE